MASPLNELYIRRKRKVMLAAGSGGPAVALPDDLGFTMTPALAARVATLAEMDRRMFLSETSSVIRKLRGADVAWTGSEALGTPEVIDLGDEAGLLAIAHALIGAATSISDTDKADVKTLVAHFEERALPAAIPFKENLTFAAALLLDHPVAPDVFLATYFTTATDVLRLAVALSDGDVSLGKPCKLKSLPRKKRRLLLAMLERIPSIDEDMWRRREVWLRFGERLHPRELADRIPNTAASFQRLRDGVRPTTFAHKVQRALAEHDAPVAVGLLKARPGELARRLDHLLRVSPSTATATLEAFAAVADQVATPVLLQAMTHFEHRTPPQPVRPILPKGNAAKLIAIKNELPEMHPGVAKAAATACERALVRKFAALPKLGRCYVDPALDRYLVPFSQRSASKALRTIVRGSRVPLPAGETLRFFLWWKEGPKTGRVDIDLTAAIFDKAYAYKEAISWTSLQSAKFRGAHSGDITSAPNGANEFIDLDLASMTKLGYRYVVALAYSFTAQKYCDLPECFMGWMMRKEPKSEEPFDPKAVQDRVDLAADQVACVPMIFDLETREMIWTDVAHAARPNAAAMIENDRATVAGLIQGMVALRKTTVKRLLDLHVEARGERVTSAAKADRVFGVDFAMDFDEMLTKYLV